MRRSFAVLLCSVSLLANPAFGQSVAIAPVRVAAGAVLKFHLQTRLNQTSGDALDALPKGTVLEVRMLDSVDSDTDRDGTEFHGTLVTPPLMQGEVIVHSEAQVRGLLVLLRSKSHPQAFRYELLVTAPTDRRKTYDLTAPLNPSVADTAAHPA